VPRHRKLNFEGKKHPLIVKARPKEQTAPLQILLLFLFIILLLLGHKIIKAFKKLEVLEKKGKMTGINLACRWCRQLRHRQVYREKEVDYRLRKGSGAESHAFAVGAYYFDFSNGFR